MQSRKITLKLITAKCKNYTFLITNVSDIRLITSPITNKFPPKRESFEVAG